MMNWKKHLIANRIKTFCLLHAFVICAAFAQREIRFRNDMPVLVVDGRVAFTGGINLADEYINKKERFGYWKDTSVKIEGSSAWSFTKMFFALWNAFYKQKSGLVLFFLF